MLVLGPIGFLAPWLLSALAALPVLWLILRAMPPAPKTVRFPGTRLLLALNLFCYSVILFAWVGYLRERDWVDAVNATAWLGVCAVLVYQMYVPGDYEGWERRAVNAAKALAYGTILGCAVWWTIDASNPLDAIDAWLWLVCFAVIELNVFGFEQDAKSDSETMRS